MNLFVVVLVLGIGVDYGVHMVHRHREALAAGADEAALNAALGETSKSVLLASLTTAVGFGSLALSGFAGLRSVGWLSVFGALGARLVGLTLLVTSLRQNTNPLPGRRSTSASGRQSRETAASLPNHHRDASSIPPSSGAE